MSAHESVLLIPALEMVPAVEEFRVRYDPSSRAGVPPHITIIYPFLNPDQLTNHKLGELDRLLETVEAFEYRLNAVREFEQGVLYLAPHPVQPFMRVTNLVSQHFNVLPYGGAFPTLVPHLTVIQSAPERERRRIRALLKGVLPRSGRASEAWLMIGHNETGWKMEHSIRFR